MALRVSWLVGLKGQSKSDGDSDKLDHTATEGDMLRALLRKVDRLHEQNDDTNPDEQDCGQNGVLNGEVCVHGRTRAYACVRTYTYVCV